MEQIFGISLKKWNWSTLSVKTFVGKHFRRQNFSSAKIFVTSRNFRHFLPTKIFCRRKFLPKRKFPEFHLFSSPFAYKFYICVNNLHLGVTQESFKKIDLKKLCHKNKINQWRGSRDIAISKSSDHVLAQNTAKSNDEILRLRWSLGRALSKSLYNTSAQPNFREKWNYKMGWKNAEELKLRGWEKWRNSHFQKECLFFAILGLVFKQIGIH